MAIAFESHRDSDSPSYAELEARVVLLSGLLREVRSCCFPEDSQSGLAKRIDDALKGGAT